MVKNMYRLGENLLENGTKTFQDFCESTSLHGYSYLYIAKSKVLKIFWVLVLITMTGLSTVFLVRNTRDYFKKNIVTIIESSTEDLTVRLFFISRVCSCFGTF